MKQPLLVSACLVAMIGTAAAEPPPADRVHDFHTMDRLTPTTTFGLAFGYEVWDGDLWGPVFGLDVSAHFVSNSGIGGYAVLPLSYLSTQDVEVGGVVVQEGQSEMMLGNIEVGGLYAMPIGKTADIVMHGGVVLPTAEESDAPFDLPSVQFIASVPRWGDLVQRIPESTWLRLGVSPMGRAGIFIWRADVGVDLALDDDNSYEIDPIIRVNVGGGVDLGQVDLTGELVTNITSPENDEADETTSTFAIGARFQAGNTQPGLAIIFPVGFDDNEDLELAIAASLAVRIP